LERATEEVWTVEVGNGPVVGRPSWVNVKSLTVGETENRSSLTVDAANRTLVGTGDPVAIVREMWLDGAKGAEGELDGAEGGGEREKEDQQESAVEEGIKKRMSGCGHGW
jgi:hypothetical protein